MYILRNWTVPAPSANRTVALFSRLAKKKIIIQKKIQKYIQKRGKLMQKPCVLN